MVRIRTVLRTLAALVLAVLAVRADARLADDSQLIGCEQADQPIAVRTNAHLDPSCVYSKGIEITASDVTLDCRGASIVDGADDDPRGILIDAPTTVPLRNVTVRNCMIEGFTNGIRVQRKGFKDLAPGEEYDPAAVFSNIVIENSYIHGSRGSGVFVDGYVTGVTLRRLEIVDAGSVGVYLEAGSAGNVVTHCDVRRNGFADANPAGIPVDIGGGAMLLVRETGREGIAVDGSRNNRISNNTIAGNSYGGIFLYKNCGEDFTRKPKQWWPRRYGADGNVIERNVIADAYTGVWIGSRMAENTYFMDCSDPFYVDAPLRRIHEDFAKGNVVRANRFVDVQYGIRVEDDLNRVERNVFLSDDPTHQAILVGTKERAAVLGRPVDGTVVRSNRAAIQGSIAPYGWIQPHSGTLFQRNRSFGKTVDVVPAVQPPINFHLFVLQILGPA